MPNNDMPPAEDDKRTWQRARLSAPVILFHEGRELHGELCDISHSGVLIAIETPLPDGTELRIDFGTDDRAVQAQARVVRQSSDHEPRGMAVSLHGVNLEDRMSLDTLIERAVQK